MGENDYLLWPYVTSINPFAKKDDIKVLRWVSDYDVLIIFNDNKKYIYDTYTGYHRYLKYNKPYLTKKEWEYEFKQRLQEVVQRKKITQEYLAEKIETTQQMVSRYLTGDAVPTAYTMNKIIDALNCKVNDLIFIPTLLKEIYKEECNNV